MYDKSIPDKEPGFIFDCMILLKNAEIISEKTGSFAAQEKDRYISFEKFCEKGCDDIQDMGYDKIKNEFIIQAYQEGLLVDLLFKCDEVHSYWNWYM